MSAGRPDALGPGGTGSSGPEPRSAVSHATRELRAIEALTFNWTSALEDVWRPSRDHVEGMHDEAAWEIRGGIGEAAIGTQRANPLGLPLLGERGVGKTHLLGWAREQVQVVGGYFFLLGTSRARRSGTRPALPSCSSSCL
jgi:hypothetical protein